MDILDTRLNIPMGQFSEKLSGRLGRAGSDGFGSVVSGQVRLVGLGQAKSGPSGWVRSSQVRRVGLGWTGLIRLCPTDRFG